MSVFDTKPYAKESGALRTAPKDLLRVLKDRPLNAETPPHLLDHAITPIDRHFVRSYGLAPEEVDRDAWRLAIDGEVERSLSLSLHDLTNDFEVVTLAVTLECAGNGRGGFPEPVEGDPWGQGAVGTAVWTGVRLSDILQAAGLTEKARFTAHHGADTQADGSPGPTLSRGIPVAKAMDPHTLVAFAMNGEALPPLHGHPLRLVVPGWAGAAWQKWLTRIELKEREHDGPKMVDGFYRLPAYPLAFGENLPDSETRVIEAMPVRSIITSPAEGTRLSAKENRLEVRGFAWAGEEEVARVQVTLDYGQTWQEAEVAAPVNRYAWQRWRLDLPLPGPGTFDVWARATDSAGRMQPFTAPGWNPRGYCNNAMQKVRVVRVKG